MKRMSIEEPAPIQNQNAPSNYNKPLLKEGQGQLIVPDAENKKYNVNQQMVGENINPSNAEQSEMEEIDMSSEFSTLSTITMKSPPSPSVMSISKSPPASSPIPNDEESRAKINGFIPPVNLSSSYIGQSDSRTNSLEEVAINNFKNVKDSVQTNSMRLQLKTTDKTIDGDGEFGGKDILFLHQSKCMIIPSGSSGSLVIPKQNPKTKKYDDYEGGIQAMKSKSTMNLLSSPLTEESDQGLSKHTCQSKMAIPTSSKIKFERKRCQKKQKLPESDMSLGNEVRVTQPIYQQCNIIPNRHPVPKQQIDCSDSTRKSMYARIEILDTPICDTINLDQNSIETYLQTHPDFLCSYVARNIDPRTLQNWLNQKQLQPALPHGCGIYPGINPSQRKCGKRKTKAKCPLMNFYAPRQSQVIEWSGKCGISPRSGGCMQQMAYGTSPGTSQMAAQVRNIRFGQPNLKGNLGTAAKICTNPISMSPAEIQFYQNRGLDMRQYQNL